MCFRKLSASVLAASWAMALVSGCSVKENRDLCPCSLVLCFEDSVGDYAGEFDVTVFSIADSFLYNAKVENGDGPHAIDVPKELLGVSVVSGCGKDGMSVSPGQDFPELYACWKQLDARVESLRDTVLLHKNFCHLDIRIVHDSPVFYPYQIVVSGNSSGYDLNGKIVSGDFLSRGVLDSKGRCCINVPRQKDDSLMLEISDGKDVLRRFPVGEYILRSGFDWQSEELGDVSLTLDYSDMTLRLSSESHTSSFYFEIDV